MLTPWVTLKKTHFVRTWKKPEVAPERRFYCSYLLSVIKNFYFVSCILFSLMSQESVRFFQWYTAVCKLIYAFGPLGICLQSSKDNTSWKLIWACLSLFPRTAVRRHHVNTIVTALSLMVEVINPGIKTVRSNRRQLSPFPVLFSSVLFSQLNFSWDNLI